MLMQLHWGQERALVSRSFICIQGISRFEQDDGSSMD
jgi:hypothetical protein